MNKADIVHKFQSYEEREDVKETMRLFTFVLAQMYEKQAMNSGIPVSKAKEHIEEEFEIDTTVYDKDELIQENAELRPKVTQLEAEKRDLIKQLKELKNARKNQAAA